MLNRHARFFNAFLFGTLATSLVAIAALITTAAKAPRAHAADVGAAPTIKLGVPLATTDPVFSGDPYAARWWCLRADRKGSSSRCDEAAIRPNRTHMMYEHDFAQRICRVVDDADNVPRENAAL